MIRLWLLNHGLNECVHAGGPPSAVSSLFRIRWAKRQSLRMNGLVAVARGIMYCFAVEEGPFDKYAAVGFIFVTDFDLGI